MHKYILLLALLAQGSFVSAQDTLKMMSYNILNYPQPGDTRDADFQTIMQAVQPDLLIAQEVATLDGADVLLNNALNTNGVSSYQRAPLMNDNGGWFGNMLFYNSDKLVLKNQTDIFVYPRDITHYEMYYNDPQLGCHEDTVFLNVFALHLKASDGASNAEIREDAISTLIAYLDAAPNLENVMIGGDFNFYSDNGDGGEPGYDLLKDQGNTHLMEDVVPGWIRSNYDYRDLYTQSTRSHDDPGNWEGVPGGLDDRFDMILFADEIMSGVGEVTVLPETYEVYGNDGYHYNTSLIDASVSVPGGGLNAEVSDEIALALFEMSDHLPVVTELKIDPVGACDLRLSVNALLQGVYDGAGAMKADLDELNLIPALQPFSAAPWNYSGTETYVVNATDPLVDWVLVEIYEKSDTSWVTSKACMLLEDGSVVDMASSSILTFEDVPLSEYFVALRSRNHLAVMSTLAQSFDAGVLLYDFSLAGQSQGNVCIADGLDYLIPAGDFNANGVMEFMDHGLYMADPSNIYNYIATDVNMDGLVTVADFNWYKSNWTSSTVSKLRY